MFRRTVDYVRRHLKESRTQSQRERGILEKPDRDDALKSEGEFWEQALADGGRNWNQAEFRERTDPHLELQPELKELINVPSGGVVRILDVGAGPLTRVGRKWPGREIEITAVDPLAERYNQILTHLGVTAPVRPTFAQAEKLLEVFARDSFDLAYASNSLDHSYDPLAAIEQMLSVVKPDCYVYLWHFANVGKHELYHDLHQWNFDVRGSDFIVSDGMITQSLMSRFQGTAELQCETTRAFDAKVVIAKLRKRRIV